MSPSRKTSNIHNASIGSRSSGGQGKKHGQNAIIAPIAANHVQPNANALIELRQKTRELTKMKAKQYELQRTIEAKTREIEKGKRDKERNDRRMKRNLIRAEIETKSAIRAGRREARILRRANDRLTAENNVVNFRNDRANFLMRYYRRRFLCPVCHVHQIDRTIIHVTNRVTHAMCQHCHFHLIMNFFGQDPPCPQCHERIAEVRIFNI